MRIQEIKIFKFDELSDSAKEKAFDWWRDSASSDEWYEYTYEDASQVGITINAFDIDRGSYCHFDNDLFDADQTYSDIIKNHGESCDTYIEAKAFESAKGLILKEYKDEESDNGLTYEGDNQLDENDLDFKKALQECYLNMLRNEYENYFSDETVTENIICNDYEFLESGDRA